MITAAHLQSFCGVSENAPWMATPFSWRRYTYAVSKTFVVKAPRIDGVAEDRHGRDVEHFISCNYSKRGVRFEPVPTVPKSIGKAERVQGFTVGEKRIQFAYLRLIAGLPGVLIGHIHRTKGMDDQEWLHKGVPFVFGTNREGFGLVAALRPEVGQ